MTNGTRVSAMMLFAAAQLCHASLSVSGRGSIRIENAGALSPAHEMTVEAWVRPAIGTGRRVVLAKGAVSSGWMLRLADNYPQLVIGGVERPFTYQIRTAEWSHVAVAFDGVTIRMYINGMLDHEERAPVARLPLTTDPVTIGGDAVGGDLFSGNIGVVRFWNSALTTADIQRNMVTILGVRPTELAAQWPLEPNARDSFAQFDGAPLGDVRFDGAPAPAFASNPIPVARASAAPVVNGYCAPGEYGQTALPIWYGVRYRPIDLIWARVTVTDTDIYVCLQDMHVRTGSAPQPSYAQVYLATTGRPLRIGITAFREVAIESLESTGWTPTRPPTGAVSAAAGLGDIFWTAEFRIARSLATLPDGNWAMAFAHQARDRAGDDFFWPQDLDGGAPSSWPRFSAASATPERPDVSAPTVTARYTSDSPIRTSSSVTFTATASDDVDLASIQIEVDYRLIRVCDLNGANDTTGSCTATAGFSPGRHSFRALARDHRGRLGFSPYDTFMVVVDGHAPGLRISHTLTTESTGIFLAVTASAMDPSGIASIAISTDIPPVFGSSCAPDGAPTAADCRGRFVAPAGRLFVSYYAEARDREGFVTRSERVYVPLNNSGPDSDGDGLSDALERAIGTNPNDKDTDHDALPDGWEVLGLQFGDGERVDLHLMGANPLRKDIFVQFDYENGVNVSDSDWQYVINQFRERGIVLHVTTNARNVSLGIAADAQVASAMTDASGQYWFRPKLAWTHHYMWARNIFGRSGTWHHVTIDTNVSDVAYRIIHELGHNLGMGHGGRLPNAHAPVDNGDAIVYPNSAADWDDTNIKPNYRSVMNYGYNGAVCFSPATGDLNTTWTFSSEQLPALDERSLNERAGALADGLRRASCGSSDSSLVAGVVHACRVGSVWETYFSDGRRVFAKFVEGAGGWVTTGLPRYSSEGIDWNCNGTIDTAPVSANINGDGGDVGWNSSGSATQEMAGNNDWATLPYGAGSACGIIRDESAELAMKIPAEYRRRIGERDCRLASVRRSSLRLESKALLASAASQQLRTPRSHGPEQLSTPLTPLIPAIEACDGRNNTGAAVPDAGCPDRDRDGLVDAIDNCPGTFNPDQADLNRNFVGDACENPRIDQIQATASANGVLLQWSTKAADIQGFGIVREDLATGSVQRIGGFPATVKTDFTDSPAPGTYRYSVRPINLAGMESEGVEVEATANKPAVEFAVKELVHGATRQPLKAVAPAMVVEIRGSGLANAKVMFDKLPAQVLWISDTALLIATPVELSGKSTTMTMGSGGDLVSFDLPILAAAPGIFTWDGSGLGPAVLQGEKGEPAAGKPGATVSILATGLGAGKRVVQAFVGGVEAKVLGVDDDPSAAGVQRVWLTIPELKANPSAELIIFCNGESSQKGVTISIQ